MTDHVFKVLVPPPVAVPRGAEWAATLAFALARIGRAAWRGLEKVGEARAHRELQRIASLHPPESEIGVTLRDAMHRAAMHRDSQH